MSRINNADRSLSDLVLKGKPYRLKSESGSDDDGPTRRLSMLHKSFRHDFMLIFAGRSESLSPAGTSRFDEERHKHTAGKHHRSCQRSSSSSSVECVTRTDFVLYPKSLTLVFRMVFLQSIREPSACPAELT